MSLEKSSISGKLCDLHSISGVSIRFTPDSYQVAEADGFVTVCTELIGETEIDVTYELSTSSGSAIQGRYSVIAL